jgi:hypothetical protein
MPSMTTKVPNLTLTGPTLDIQVLISSELQEQLTKVKNEIPNPIPIKALIDTGASHSIIRKEIPEKLNLKPIGTVKINTPSSKDHECYQYFMRLIFPSHGLSYEGIFTATPLEGQNIDCLIGRDLLASSILIYIGYDNSFTLSIM